MVLRTLLLTLAAALLLAVPGKAAALPAGFDQDLFENGLSSPTSMAWRPGGVRLYVAEKGGDLRVIERGVLLNDPVYSVSVNSASERGLLGVAVDPSFASNRFVYIYYTRASAPVKNRVSRITLDATQNVAVPGSEVILLDDIPSDAGNHNAGALHFTKSGKLMIATGDGGSFSDQSQDVNNLAGKLLRINKNGTIPADNPFVGMANHREEIWSYGLRNPFTFAVKLSTGSIFINDVGANSWEEINKAAKGGNFGWPDCEGACSDPDFIDPVYQYSHSVGQAITGGAFYEQTQFPSGYRGNYFFGDYIDNFIKWYNVKTDTVKSFHSTAHSPVDIDIGGSGTLYYLSIGDGAVYKITY